MPQWIRLMVLRKLLSGFSARGALAWGLAATLLVSAVGKTLDFWSFLKAIYSYGFVPSRYIVLVGVLVILAEFGCAVLLVQRRTRALGAALASLLFAVFLEAGILSRAVGTHAQCGCFGFAQMDAAGWPHLLLQGTLMTVALALLMGDRRVARAFSADGVRRTFILAVGAGGLLASLVVAARIAQRRAEQVAAVPPAAGKSFSHGHAANGTEAQRPSQRTRTIRLEASVTIGPERDRRLGFQMPRTIRRSRGGNLLILDSFNDRVVEVDTSGSFIGSFGKSGKGPGELRQPWAMDVDRNGNIYVADAGNGRVCMFSANGSFLRSFRTRANLECIAVDSSGLIYLNEPSRGRLISVYRADGSLVTTFGELLPYKQPAPPFPGAANTVVFDIDGNENLWMAFQLHPEPEVRKYDPKHRLVLRMKLAVPEVEKELATYHKRASGTVYPRFAEALYVDKLNRVWLLLNYRSTIYCFNPDGSVAFRVQPVDPRVETQMYLIGGICVAGSRMWCTDIYRGELVLFLIPQP